jgi:transposase InsO family protein
VQASRCHPLAPRGRRRCEILNLIDDHSRLVIASVARRTFSGPDVVATFTTAFTRVGTPAAVRTDNSAVFTGAARRGGRAALEITLGAGVPDGR